MPHGAILLLAFGAAALPLAAQDAAAPRLVVEARLDSAGAPRPPVVRATGLPGSVFFGALRNGYPVRFAFQLQLWRDARLVDQFEREARWEAVVTLDPLTETYQLLRSGGSAPETFSTAASLEAALAIPFAVELAPARPSGRTWYYIATLTMESLSVSELEEIERWLRGDLGPSIEGGRDVDNALSRGARLLMIRLSGLPHRQIEARSVRFRW